MREALSVVCFQWNNGFRDYAPRYVNVLARAFKRNISIPHRFICITDEVHGFSDDVELIRLPDEARKVASIPSPEGPRFPASFRRLWALSQEAKSLGDVLLMTDIDCTITGSVDPLVEHIYKAGVDFVGWRPCSLWGTTRERIGGGTWLVRAGAHAEVWEEFAQDPQGSIKKARDAGFRGSDQAYLSWKFKGCEVWPKDSGIYQAQDVKPNGYKRLPPGARIVHFNGKIKPWTMTHIPWIKQHWC